ncbi:MAG: ABC transporter permease [Alphaproteobacteria bacterium]|nr:ABC transporter permease [Alphaproteobacteria bacterium]
MIASLSALYRHWDFMVAMSRRELKVVHKGWLLGAGWLVIGPLVRVGAYVMLVSVVFRQHVAGMEGALGYALYVLSGLIPWQIMIRTLEESPDMIRQRLDMLKQTPYPVEILPALHLSPTLLAAGAATAIFFLLALVSGKFGPHILLFPIPLALLISFCIGTAWLLSIVGLVLRDLREVLSIVLGLLIYVSPVVLSENMLGETLWMVVLANPLSHAVITFRDTLLGQWHPLSWIVFAVLSTSSLLAGAWAIAKVKIHINDLG